MIIITGWVNSSDFKGRHRMNPRASIKKLSFCMILVVIGTVFCLNLFLGAASADTFTTSTASLSGYDVTPPLFTRVDAREDDDHGSATVEAEFLDVDSEVDPEGDSMQVSEALVTGCVKTDRKINCKASGMKSGKHSMKVSVKDKYGNRSEREHTFEVIDKAAPVIDSVNATTENVTVKYHDQAPSSGIKSIVVTVDGFELDCCSVESKRNHDWDSCDAEYDEHTNGLGPYLGWGHCQHGNGYGYGHEHDSDSDSFGHLAANCSSEDGTTSCEDDYERQRSHGSIGLTCPILQTLGCGPHEVVVTITDKAGNTTTSTTVLNSDGDCTAPETTDDAPAGWQNTDVAVNLTCTDAGSGCAGTTYEVDGGATQTGNTVTLTTDGIHSIIYRSVDVAGNIEVDKTATVMIDKTPPDVTTSGDMTVEATGPSGASADFTSSATDALSGVVGETSCTPASGSTFPLGITTVSCSAIDAAGNTGTATMTVTVVDTTAPAVIYGGPTDTIYTSESPTITGTATDAVGVVSAVASIDGGPDIACTIDAGNISCLTSDVAYSSHTVVITATDAAGNASTATGTFCKSSGRPNLTLYKVKGPYVVAGDPYRWVTVDYRMDNIGPDAYNVSMLSMTATNGIYLASPSPLPVLGDIAPGGSVSFSVKYYWPVGVSTYKFTNTACAYDQCFTEYIYP